MEFLGYFGAVFEPVSFLLLLGGTVGGLILGSTPGLSPTMAIALLIPFTLHLQPAQGLILLGAVYVSTVAGGAVSAILLNIPGSPANIPTTRDGHAMVRRGKGARALQLSFLATAFGGATGIFLLIFLTPFIAEWVLAFGPSHLFWLAILAVIVIGTLDATSMVKGLLSGCIGLWLATIGFDDIFGVERFVFHPVLGGGVNLTAALIGLFAIPQAISMFAGGRHAAGRKVPRIERHPVGRAIGELFARARALTIGTAAGSLLGFIPGVGGQIAAFVAYDRTKRLSPERERFGAGHPEGVIAAESANSAMIGPALVSLLTLSIPGGPAQAVLLGGLLIHGIFPGTDLFENYPEVAWTFINSLLVCQVLMLLFGLYIAGLAARVAQVPHSAMAAIVLGLAIFGSYSVQNSMGDVYVMTGLGVAMYFLNRYGYPAAPLVLGLILGPIAEENFTQGFLIAGAGDGPLVYFFTGGLNMVLIALAFLSIAYPILAGSNRRRGSRRARRRMGREGAA